jgi:hypothetical protein
MNILRLFLTPSLSTTLTFVVIATLAFILLSASSIDVLYKQGQLLTGISLFFSGIGAISSLGFRVYDLQKETQDRKNKQHEAEDKLFENILVIIKSYKEVSSEDLKDIEKMVTPEFSDRMDVFLDRVPRITAQIDFRREIAKHLESETYDFRKLIVESTNETLDNLSQSHLEKLGLLTKSSRSSLYNDIRLYLRGWLKNSIEYNMPMPIDRVHQSYLDRKLYIDIVEHIRKHKIDRLNLKNDQQKAMVIEYLDILVKKLSLS